MNHITLRRQRWFVCALAVVFVAASAQALAQPPAFSVPGVPDLSQHEQRGWRNYCAPTAGTNVAYQFLPAFPSLDRGLTETENIAGFAPLPFPIPPAPGSMADLMQTSRITGTNLVNLRDGLHAYMTTNAPAGNWRTDILLADPSYGGVGGPAFLNTLQSELSGGAGIVLAIHWPGGPPPPGDEYDYDLPDPYDSDNNSEEGAMGHAVTMVGYDDPAFTLDVNDPANNLIGGVAVHNLPPAVPDTYNIVVLPNRIDFSTGQIAGSIYGAVITVAEPTSFALAAWGLLVLGGLGLWRRKRSPICADKAPN